LGEEKCYFSKGNSVGGLSEPKGGKLMAPIVAQTRYGDTIFVSHPANAAQALVTWAVLTHGHSMNSIETLEGGCVRVDIPGLTSITFAPENIIDA
jgi:hypothetical protein